jgi:hypothetical protein
MAWSGRQKHRDRDPGARAAEPAPAPANRTFRIGEDQRQAIAASLRHVDEVRTTLEAEQNAKNRIIIRELRASADHIFDIINNLEEIE